MARRLRRPRHWNCKAGTIPSTWGSHLRRGGARRRGRHRRRAAWPVGLAGLDGHDRRRRDGEAGPVYRLLRIVCREPPGAGRGCRVSGGSAECGAGGGRGSGGIAGGEIVGAGPEFEASAAEVRGLTPQVSVPFLTLV